MTRVTKAQADWLASVGSKPRRLTQYGDHPICPRCGHTGFDDWWHVLRDRPRLQPGGKLECGRCEKVFFIEGTPGNLWSVCYGLDDTDLALRANLRLPRPQALGGTP
jgi:ribosomal protein S27AE